ncbi:MAG TPA: flagellar biosynthesis protein FlhB [Pseudidiomarina sp.]|nr:flagellar biosynthesis protein FlhB [Pseudidiomarina sp.]
MAEQQQSDQEKTEDPTPRRIQKSRDEGQVARSRELTTFVLLFGGLIALWGMSSDIYARLGTVMEQAFLFERLAVTEPGPMLTNSLGLAEQALFALLPLFIVMVVLALVAPALLGGWLISAKSLQPKLDKLSLAKGLKRIFSAQSLAELGKAIAKTILVGGVLCWFLWSNRETFMGLMTLPTREALYSALDLAALACLLMVMVLVVVVLFDVPYQIFTHNKKLRMTKDEVKRENKETEGDPHLKAKIRQQQQAMARRRMMVDVPSADVIVTNPTHYAVALKYDEVGSGAPKVVAKGTDLIAQRIRDIATEHDVPLLEAPPLARALNRHVDIGREIPADLYTAVAEVLAWAFQLKKAARGDGVFPPTPRNIVVPENMQVEAS